MIITTELVTIISVDHRLSYSPYRGDARTKRTSNSKYKRMINECFVQSRILFVAQSCYSDTADLNRITLLKYPIETS